jgi:prolyl-tRNA editing enzyme YbaK/EbsC (Cys-tRNA(Pro) deacylase)
VPTAVVPFVVTGSAGVFQIGALRTVPVREQSELLCETTRHWLETAGLLDVVGVVEIDPQLSDTASTQRAYDLPLASLVNCVVVGGKREGSERLAACAVLATTRADVNGRVRRALDVRKASFLETERAVALTGMEYGAITPIGLPSDWPVYVDMRVVQSEAIILGSGIRRSKIVLEGALLRRLANVVVLADLGV